MREWKLEEIKALSRIYWIIGIFLANDDLQPIIDLAHWAEEVLRDAGYDENGEEK